MKMIFGLPFLFLIISSLLLGCSEPQEPFWDDYFQLVQSGQKKEGTIIGYHYHKPERSPATPGAEVEIEYDDESGNTRRFKEIWPIDYKDRYDTGSKIVFYEYPQNQNVPRATVVLLGLKKVIPPSGPAVN